MSKLTLFADAVKFSTTQQLNAVFEDAKVRVEYDDNRWGYVTVQVSVWHRRKQWAFDRQFPIGYAIDCGEDFYEDFMRKQFPRLIARAVIDVVMDEAL